MSKVTTKKELDILGGIIDLMEMMEEDKEAIGRTMRYLWDRYIENPPKEEE